MRICMLESRCNIMKQNLKKVHLTFEISMMIYFQILSIFLIVNMLDMIDLQALSTAEFTEKPN